MNKSLKAGILIIILGVPALSFVFLKIFGNNNFDLPYFFPVLDDKDEVVIVNGDTSFVRLEAFTLEDQNSETYSFDNGKIRVVSFFFSRCGSICPILNANLFEVADSFKDQDKVEFVGLTVDPKHDTPAVLKEYGKVFNIEKLNYKLLTGDKAKIYDICLGTFKLPVADASEYDKTIKDVDEMFIHSDRVILVDTEGFVRGIYTGTDKEEVDRLRLEIKVLLSQFSK